MSRYSISCCRLLFNRIEWDQVKSNEMKSDQINLDRINSDRIRSNKIGLNREIQSIIIDMRKRKERHRQFNVTNNQQQRTSITYYIGLVDLTN